MINAATGEIAEVYERPDTRPREYVIARLWPGSRSKRLPGMTYATSEHALGNFVQENSFVVHTEAGEWSTKRSHAA